MTRQRGENVVIDADLYEAYQRLLNSANGTTADRIAHAAERIAAAVETLAIAASQIDQNIFRAALAVENAIDRRR